MSGVVADNIDELCRRAVEMDDRRQRQIGEQVKIINRLLGDTNKGNAQAAELSRLAGELASAQERLETLCRKVLLIADEMKLDPVARRAVRKAVKESYL